MPKAKKRLDVSHFDRSPQPFTDMLDVPNKDPEYQYRNAKNNPVKIAYWKNLGFELVMADKEDPTKHTETDQVDRCMRTAGSYVVMRRPKELAMQHAAYRDKKAERAKRGPIEAFKTIAQRSGVEVIDETKMIRAPLGAVMAEDIEDDA